MRKEQCEFCGKDIWRKASNLKRYKHHYCNRQCRYDKIRSLQPIVKCSACGKKIVLHAGRKRNSRTGLYFCSNKCKNPYIAKYNRWAENPDGHRERRPYVLEAAEYTCQNCGYNKEPILLDIHHNDGNHRNNEWSNLRCLCVMCHIGYHRGCIILKSTKELSNIVLSLIKVDKNNKIEEMRDKLEQENQKNKCCRCHASIGKKTKNKLCPVCFSKSRRKAIRPSKSILEEQVKEFGYCGTGRMYNVSDNTVRKWIKSRV